MVICLCQVTCFMVMTTGNIMPNVNAYGKVKVDVVSFYGIE
jgi:hypothetical protein